MGMQIKEGSTTLPVPNYAQKNWNYSKASKSNYL